MVLAIYGIEGGIGCGKTLTLVSMMLKDLKSGKKIMTNTALKNLPPKLKKNVMYLTKDAINTIFEKVKSKKLKMENVTVGIQEMHNYLDSRRSLDKKNVMLTYWILQSRHTGRGSCDIIYDTQELTQVDLRLRKNTDFRIRPTLLLNEVTDLPEFVIMDMVGKVGHRYCRFREVVSVSEARDCYDTHELVDF